MQFAQRLGAPPSAAFHDVFGLDPDLLAMVPQPVRAVLLLFPITKQVSEWALCRCLCFCLFGIIMAASLKSQH